MGQFANTMFSMLLGWVQTAASWLWSLFTNAEVNGGLRWLLENWLPLLLLLCAGGLVIDFVIYLFRWQPYRVWGRALRRLNNRAESEENEEDPGLAQRSWVFADGTITPEGQLQRVPEKIPESQGEQLQTPVRPLRRVARYGSREQSYNQPVYPPQWQQKGKQGDNE